MKRKRVRRRKEGLTFLEDFSDTWQPCTLSPSSPPVSHTLLHSIFLFHSHTPVFHCAIPQYSILYSDTLIHHPPIHSFPYSDTPIISFTHSHTLRHSLIHSFPYSDALIVPYSDTPFSHTLIPTLIMPFSHTLIPHTPIFSFPHTANLHSFIPRWEGM